MDLFATLPQLVELVQKGGVVGLLIIFCAVMAWEVIRLRKLSAVVYAERDAYRLRYTLYKSACDSAHITVDVSALSQLPELSAPA